MMPSALSVKPSIERASKRAVSPYCVRSKNDGSEP
jgi:hypothetical protein